MENLWGLVSEPWYLEHGFGISDASNDKGIHAGCIYKTFRSTYSWVMSVCLLLTHIQQQQPKIGTCASEG